MSTVWDGEVFVEYGFAFIRVEGDDEDAGFGREGQANGLIGAAIPGMLSLTFGMHTGFVPLTIELIPTDPGVSEEWEDVVEASVTLRDRVEYNLETFQDFYPVDLPGGTLRVRFSAVGMDAADDGYPRDEGAEVIDRYLLQLWPEPHQRPDAVVRLGSEIAAYWHGVAREESQGNTDSSLVELVETAVARVSTSSTSGSALP